MHGRVAVESSSISASTHNVLNPNVVAAELNPKRVAPSFVGGQSIEILCCKYFRP